jgi:hypothetical protein
MTEYDNVYNKGIYENSIQNEISVTAAGDIVCHIVSGSLRAKGNSEYSAAGGIGRYT